MDGIDSLRLHSFVLYAEPIEEALSNANPEMIHLSNGDALLTSLDKTIDNKINLRL